MLVKWSNYAFVYAFIIQQFRSSLDRKPTAFIFIFGITGKNMPGSRDYSLATQASILQIASALEAQLVAASHLLDPGADPGFSKKGS